MSPGEWRFIAETSRAVHVCVCVCVCVCVIYDFL